MATFAEMQRARYAERRSRSKYGSARRKYDAVDKDVMARSGLTPAEYDSLLPEARKKVLEKYGSGELTSTSYSRSTARYTLPDGTETDWAGARAWEAAEKERVARELSKQLVETAVREDAQKATARGGYIYAEKRPSQPTTPKKGMEGFKEGFNALTPGARMGVTAPVEREYAINEETTLKTSLRNTAYEPVKSTSRVVRAGRWVKREVLQPTNEWVKNPLNPSGSGLVLWAARESGEGYSWVSEKLTNAYDAQRARGASYQGATALGAMTTRVVGRSLTQAGENPLGFAGYQVVIGPQGYLVWKGVEAYTFVGTPKAERDLWYDPVTTRTLNRNARMFVDVFSPGGFRERVAEDLRSYPERDKYIAAVVSRRKSVFLQNFGSGLFIERASELRGQYLVAKWGPSLSKSATRFGVRNPWARRFVTTAPPIALAGVQEGVAQYSIDTEITGAEWNPISATGWGAFGAASAGLVGGGIASSLASKYRKVRRVGRVINVLADVADPLEDLGDRAAFATLSGRARRGLPVVVPAFVGANTPTASIVRSRLTVSSRSTVMDKVSSTTKQRVGVLSPAKLQTTQRTSTRTKLPTTTRLTTSSRTLAPAQILTNINARSTITVPSNVLTPSTVPVTVTVPVGGGFPFLPFGGIFGGRRRGGSLRGAKRLLGSTPSLAALELNIRGNGRSPVGGYTGFELRGLPGLRRRKSRRKRL